MRLSLPRVTFARPSTSLLESQEIDKLKRRLAEEIAKAKHLWDEDPENYDKKHGYERLRYHCKEVLERITEAKEMTR